MSEAGPTFESSAEDPAGDPPEDLDAALDAEHVAAERAATEHWRRLARQRGAALDAIRRRTSVRALLALERRSEPLRERLAAARARVDARIARVALSGRALPTRPGLHRRRAKLAVALRELPSKPLTEPRSISIVTLASEDAVGAVAMAMHRASSARGDLLCFRSPAMEPLSDGWLERLALEVRGPIVAATPMLVHPARVFGDATPHDLRVRTIGVDVALDARGAPIALGREAGADPSTARSSVDVDSAPGTCLVVDQQAFEAAGGFAPLEDLDAAVFDLCQRLRASGKSIVAVPSVIALDHRPVASVEDLTMPIHRSGPGWRAIVERHGPALVRSTRRSEPGPSTFAVTIAAPSTKVAHRWGDWHFATALQRSLRHLGHQAIVQTADRADDLVGRSSDVHVVLRGLMAVRRTSGQHHVLWIISHPEDIDIEECDEADLVLVASQRFADELRGRTRTPVQVLLQATDHRRFRPLPTDPSHEHAVVVVAKTRDEMRPAVADALAAGLRPAIYGSGWEEFVDPELIVADYVPNEALPLVYSSAGVVLNDHWGTMRSWGFVSNRLFDALACGAPVISDGLPEIHDLFGGAVPTYRDAADLRKLVATDLADPGAARRRAATGRDRVLATHTFDHRAQDLLDALARYHLDRPPS